MLSLRLAVLLLDPDVKSNPFFACQGGFSLVCSDSLKGSLLTRYETPLPTLDPRSSTPVARSCFATTCGFPFFFFSVKSIVFGCLQTCVLNAGKIASFFCTLSQFEDRAACGCFPGCSKHCLPFLFIFCCLHVINVLMHKTEPHAERIPIWNVHTHLTSFLSL